MFASVLILFQASARQLARRELFRSQRALVSHGCQAEYHNAMAVMYRERVQRLQEVVAGDGIDIRITPAQIREVMP